MRAETGPMLFLLLFALLLAPARAELPFSLSLAPGWSSEDRGDYLFTCPPYAPAGMDVHVIGTFEPDEEKRVRREVALEWAQDLRPEATLDDMSTVVVDGAEALYYETRPFPNRVWRQWVFFRGGRCYLIVSACEPRFDVRMRREVDSMVASFHAP